MTGADGKGGAEVISQAWVDFHTKATWPSHAPTGPHDALVGFAAAITESEAYDAPLVPPVPDGLREEIVNYGEAHAGYNDDPEGPAQHPPAEAQKLASEAVIFLFTRQETE